MSSYQLRLHNAEQSCRYLRRLPWNPAVEDSYVAPLPDSAPPSGADWLV